MDDSPGPDGAPDFPVHDEGALGLEYREPIGLTRRRVPSGCLAHVHNLRSARWQRSE